MYLTFDIPEIPEYSFGFPEYWVKTVFIRSASASYQVNALANTYVRLVEAALVEYRSGTIKVREFWDTHTYFNLSAMHRSMSHFEACVTNIHRATNCFRRLTRQQDSFAVALNSGKANFATDAVADIFRHIRNDIHHLEAKVLDGRLTEGPFALAPDGPEVAHGSESNQTVKTIDRLTIGKRQLTFKELATCLTEMASFAASMADLLPSSASPGQGDGMANQEPRT